MTIVIAILVALVLAYLAFRFVKGVVKLGTLVILVLFCVFVAHQAGAF